MLKSDWPAQGYLEPHYLELLQVLSTGHIVSIMIYAHTHCYNSIYSVSLRIWTILFKQLEYCDNHCYWMCLHQYMNVNILCRWSGWNKTCFWEWLISKMSMVDWVAAPLVASEWPRMLIERVKCIQKCLDYFLLVSWLVIEYQKWLLSTGALVSLDSVSAMMTCSFHYQLFINTCLKETSHSCYTVKSLIWLCQEYSVQ